MRPPLVTAEPERANLGGFADSLVLDGTERFDSLDEAAKFLEVTNMTGLAFWALERADGVLVPLQDLASGATRREVESVV